MSNYLFIHCKVKKRKIVLYACTLWASIGRQKQIAENVGGERQLLFCMNIGFCRFFFLFFLFLMDYPLITHAISKGPLCYNWGEDLIQSLKFLPQKEKKVTREAETLHTSCATVTIFRHGSFQHPNSYGRKNKDSTGNEEDIKIISNRSNKILLSSVHHLKATEKPHVHASYSVISNSWENTEFAHRGSLVILIALCFKGIWLLQV